MRALVRVVYALVRVVYATMVLITWLHAQLVAPIASWWLDSVVGGAEESARAAVRETFHFTTRGINAAASWAVTILLSRNTFKKWGNVDGDGGDRPAAWRRWWAERGGTFNHVIARDLSLRGRSPSPESRGKRRDDGHLGGIGALKRRPRLLWAPLTSMAKFLGSIIGGGGKSPKMGGNKNDGALHHSGSDLFDVPSGFVSAGLASHRRTGLLEDSRLAADLAIVAAFDVLRSLARRALLLGPSSSSPTDYPSSTALRRNGRCTGIQPMAPDPWDDPLGGVHSPANIILQAGYPVQEHTVITRDGYVLRVQRIPRPETRDAVLFLHGVMDTSLGWVAAGHRGSHALAAHDAGMDVWLGNSRSSPPVEHADPKVGCGTARYWRFSINEMGTEDVAALVGLVDDVKRAELAGSAGVGVVAGKEGSSRGCRGGGGARRRHCGTSADPEDPLDSPVEEEENSWSPSSTSSSSPNSPPLHSDPDLYRLSLVAHSLGGASALIYATTCRAGEKPHRLHRLVLLSPAGFHTKYPRVGASLSTRRTFLFYHYFFVGRVDTCDSCCCSPAVEVIVLFCVALSPPLPPCIVL
jgi:hypothetical protein